MFNRPSNNNFQPGGGGNNNDVNTGIKTFFSSLSCFTISCWNDAFSMKFTPATAPDANGHNHYDKNQKIQGSLSVSEASALLKRYEKRLQEKVDAKADPGDGMNTSVELPRKDGTHILSIEYKKDEQAVPSVYLTFIRNNGPTISYKFNDVGVIDDYNASTGGGAAYRVEGELEFFLNILRNSHLLTSMSNHAAKLAKQAQKAAGFGGFLSGGSNQQEANADFMNTYDNGMSELPFT